MIDFEKFAEGKNWAFTQGPHGAFVVASSAIPGGAMFQIMSARGEAGVEYACVEGIENAYEAVIASLSDYAAEEVERGRRSEEGAMEEQRAICLAVERGGFQPGTFKPHGVTKLVASVFVSQERPGAMLIASAPFYADDRGSAASLVQVEREDASWTVTRLSRELAGAVERSDCVWAKDALAGKGVAREADGGSPAP